MKKLVILSTNLAVATVAAAAAASAALGICLAGAH